MERHRQLAALAKHATALRSSTDRTLAIFEKHLQPKTAAHRAQKS
jgi:hypothetical protein